MYYVNPKPQSSRAQPLRARAGRGDLRVDEGIASSSRRSGTPRKDAPYDVVALRAQFPILSRTMRGAPLVFLDNASTTQKPQRVIDAEKRFYETTNTNIHRGVYELSEEATAAYVAAHDAVARFVHARSAEEVVFTRNATEAINLVARSLVDSRLVTPDSRLVLTAMEHHSNIVPWQEVARRTGTSIQWVELTPEGQLDLESLGRALAFDKPPTFEAPQTSEVCLVAVTHVSNVLGTVNPIAEIVRLSHEAGALVLVDAAQSAGRLPIDVQAWGADFVVFSAHKMYGPTGVGVLYAKRDHLERMEPYVRGGDMVKTVTREGATWNDLPWKFEAGTPNIAGGVAFGEAIAFLEEGGIKNVWAHEQELVCYALPRLQAVPGLRLLGPVFARSEAPYQSSGSLRGEATKQSHGGHEIASAAAGGLAKTSARAGVFSFTLPGVHSHDLASFLDARGIAIRGGHHCAMPLHTSLGLTESARASVGVYTTTEEIDRLVAALEEAREALA